VGASGAISGLLGAFLALCAAVRVRVFYLWLPAVRPLYGSVEVPSALFLVLWFLGQFLYAVSFSELAASVEVAYWAHVGGFVFGAVLGLGAGLPAALRDAAREWAVRRRFGRALAAARGGAPRQAAAWLEELRAEGRLPPAAELLVARARLEAGEQEAAATEADIAFRRALTTKERARMLDAYCLLQAAGRAPALNAQEALVLARALGERGESDAASGLLAEALRQDPRHPAADALLLELAELDARRGERDRAAGILSLLLKEFPASKLAASVEWRLKELTGGAATNG
jgi:tetratricopeptide (TPR) repeat protein